LRFLAAASLALAAAGAEPEPIDIAWADLSWGEPDTAIVRHFGARATVLPEPIEFGDSYADIVLRHVDIGGYQLIAYYQMDKVTHGLKRIQLERPHRGVNPPAYRAVTAALAAAYGPPALSCDAPPVPENGYQAALEQWWQYDGAAIHAIFRDTTLEAFEGCYFPPCGLTGRMLIRISPLATEAMRCTTPAARQRTG
jgi:hypothetical protein